MLLAVVVGPALGLHVSAAALQPRASVVSSRASVRLTEPPSTATQAKTANNDLIPEEPSLSDWVNNMPIAMSKSLARTILLSETKEPEPLPDVWHWFWDAMPFLAAGKKGEPPPSGGGAGGSSARRRPAPGHSCRSGRRAARQRM